MAKKWSFFNHTCAPVSIPLIKIFAQAGLLLDPGRLNGYKRNTLLLPQNCGAVCTDLPLTLI